MWRKIARANASVERVVMTDSNEGLRRVQAGDERGPPFAFLMESSMIEYNTRKHCDLMQVGPELDSKSYGFGLPKGTCSIRFPLVRIAVSASVY